jgi:hypothetical protein
VLGEILPLVLAGAGSNPSAADVPASAGERRPLISDRAREGWLLSVEGVTHVPLDVGAELGVETPFGLRLFAGYGFVPEAYIGALTGIAANATGDPRARILLDAVEYSGRTARVTLGVRPFRKLGFYLDAGYVHLRLEAARDIPDLSSFGLVPIRGGSRATSGFDLWVVELGYQLQLAQRLVLAAGLGVTGTLDAKTRIAPTGGAPNDPALPEAARQVDVAFERYGYLPTLTLRIGFDLI